MPNVLPGVVSSLLMKLGDTFFIWLIFLLPSYQIFASAYTLLLISNIPLSGFEMRDLD